MLTCHPPPLPSEMSTSDPVSDPRTQDPMSQYLSFLESWRGISFHFFLESTHAFRDLTPASFLCLKSFLLGSSITVSCQVGRKGIAYPPHVSMPTISPTFRRACLNCQEIASLGCHQPKSLTEVKLVQAALVGGGHGRLLI